MASRLVPPERQNLGEVLRENGLDTYDELRASGELLPIEPCDITALARQAVCDTAEAARILGCSRQNISDLVRRGKLVPLKKGSRGTVFLRADVLARRG